MTKLFYHPFKMGIQAILDSHFAPEIAKNFRLEFEADIYRKDLPNIWKQLKDDVLILEVRYNKNADTSVYLCDVRSDWDRELCAMELLSAIGAKWSAGKLGEDWTAKGNVIRMSKKAKEVREASLS